MRGRMVRAGSILAAILLSTTGGPVAAGGALSLDPVGDGILLPVSIGLAGTGEYLAATAPVPSLPAPSIAQIDALDRLALFAYSRGVDVASTVLESMAIAAPIGLALVVDCPQVLPALVVTAEAMFLAEGVKSFMKYLIPRYRPYLYAGGAPGVPSREDAQSFPSGHATMAFAGATVASCLFGLYWPDSPLRVPFVVTVYTVAATTASFRVLAGMHFITDVIAGSLIGTLSAAGVVLLHEDRARAATSPGLSVIVGGRGVALRYRFAAGG